ncbi:MAG: winged helix-turn-helix domain-containing protein [Pyrinomonadaceae bacterium]
MAVASAMSDLPTEHRAFLFEGFALDAASRTLAENGEEIRLAHRPFDILVELVENRERVVSRHELLDKYWDGRYVYDDALRKSVAAIRKALGDSGKPARFIETRYGDGFRFVADVRSIVQNGTNGSNGHYTANFGQNGRVPSVSSPSKLIAWGPRLIVVFVLAVALVVFAVVFVTGSLGWLGSIAGTAPADAPIRSLVVMPIRNVSGEADNQYLSDGVTESVITQLSRSNELKIFPGGSLYSSKNNDRDPLEVGRQLNADAILEGSLQRRGDAVNVRMRLVRIRDGSVAWTSNDFERLITSAYDLQDAIACDIASELTTELCGGENKKNTKIGIAYQEYLKGRYEWNKRTADGIKRSIDHYKLALEYDPKYSLAYAGLADSYVQGVWHVPFVASEVFPKARDAALKAISFDETSAEAHTALAGAYGMEWKWAEASAELSRAIELDPRYARAHHVQAFNLMMMARFDDSIASIERAAELDPLNLVIQTDRANLLLIAGREEDAFRQWQTMIEREPDFAMARQHRAAAYEHLGYEREAIDEIADMMHAQGKTAAEIDAFRRIAQKAGLKQVRRFDLNRLLGEKARGKRVSPVNIAYYYALVGERDKAIKALETACSERDSRMVLIVSAEFLSLRPDTRFSALLDCVGLRVRKEQTAE